MLLFVQMSNPTKFGNMTVKWRHYKSPIKGEAATKDNQNSHFVSSRESDQYLVLVGGNLINLINDQTAV